MNQAEINDAEWRNPANWHGGWLGFYVSPRDTRVWVPKRKPGLGWTLNMAHRSGRLWLLALLALPVVIVAVTATFAASASHGR
jgi:uncharacterized membrane protein